MNTYPLSKVYLYNTSIRPEKNAYVDDLEQYLATFQATPVEAQYQKHALKLLVKLNVAEKAQTDYSYNYCKIVNYTSADVPETAIYYFIDSVNVKSPSAVELLCTMDTINTLGQGVASYGNPRNFINETEITREHLDRFVRPSTWVPESGGYLVRFIDPESEGIVPNKVKKRGTDAVTGGDVTLKADDDCDWYIIYRNEVQVDPNNPNPPIETLLCASMPIQVGGASSAASKTFTISDFEVGKYYYFLDVDNPQGTIDGIVLDTNIRKIVKFENPGPTPYWADRLLRGFVFHRPDNATLYYSACYEKKVRTSNDYESLNSTDFWSSATQDPGVPADLPTTWTGIYSLQFTCTKGNLFRVSNVDYTQVMSSPEGIAKLVPLEYNISVGYTSQTLNTIDAIDRTDPRIVKIIKYPYCPINATKSGGAYQFGVDWEYDLGFLKYQKTDVPTFGNYNVVSFKNTNELLFNFLNTYATPKHSKIENAESKLFHSEFYTAKLVYDSFALPIQYEHFTWDDQEESTDFLVDFKPTSTINSKFAFKVKMPGVYKQSSDFDQYLLASRNNEETILNSEYINYVKNGYHYDKKANSLAVEQAQRNANTNTIGTAVSVAAGLAALLLSPTTGGVSAAAGIGLLSGAVMGGINAANAWANVSKLEEQQANTMQSKLAQLQAQAASTSGTDDVDLMSWYSGNRLHLMRYEPIPQVKTALYKAFDLTGYSHHVYGTPAVDTRYWYNFIQCTPVLINEGCAPWKNEWLADLKARYQQGVTVFHKQTELVNGVALPVWNFDQLYENWETWVINGIPAQI